MECVTLGTLDLATHLELVMFTMYECPAWLIGGILHGSVVMLD